MNDLIIKQNGNIKKTYYFNAQLNTSIIYDNINLVWIGYCPSLNIYVYSNTPYSAENCIANGILSYIKFHLKENTLYDILDKCKFVKYEGNDKQNHFIEIISNNETIKFIPPESLQQLVPIHKLSSGLLNFAVKKDE